MSFMARQQFVIFANNAGSPDGAMPAIGTRAEILHELAGCNTGPQREGEDVLYGPGICIELPPGLDPVTQMLLTLTEEEIGWLVLMRLAKKFQWKIFDPESGRELALSADD